MLNLGVKGKQGTQFKNDNTTNLVTLKLLYQNEKYLLQKLLFDIQ